MRAFARNFDDGSNGRTEVSLTHAKRSSPEWEAVEEAGMHLDVALLLMRERLGTIGDALASLGGDDPDDPLGLDVARAIDRTEVLRHAIRESVLTVARDQIVWVALGEGDVRVSPRTTRCGTAARRRPVRGAGLRARDQRDPEGG